GIDISEPTVVRARAAFTRTAPLRGVAADVRALPFRDASFDAIYSMGTIEHFAETELAVEEMTRVLKPGGRRSSGCRTATTRSCGRSSPRCCKPSGSTPTATKNLIRGGRCERCSNERD